MRERKRVPEREEKQRTEGEGVGGREKRRFEMKEGRKEGLNKIG